MRVCRFNDDRIGVVRPDGVHDVTSILNKLPPVRYPFPLGDPLIVNLESWRPEMEALADKAPALDPNELCFKSPVANPTKIIGVPVNYQAHRDEMAASKGVSAISSGVAERGVESVLTQGLFLKANSSLVGPSEGIATRFPDRSNHHEAELGVIIGKTGSDIPEDEAYDYIVGYALAMDMVVRGKEDRSFRKSIDTYSVLGPWLVTKDEVPDPQNLNFTLKVNDEVRQHANTRDMIMYIKQQIAWGSTFYTMYPGDIIMTGTCEGVGRVAPGDVVDFEFEILGSMQVRVRAHEIGGSRTFADREGRQNHSGLG